jgi:4a-hydroxytetrahydrobiopterin dehydratase
MAISLAEQHCVDCEPGTPPFDDAEINRLLPQVDGWAVQETIDRRMILTKTYRHKGFVPGVQFIDRIAEIAEAEGHHPDLHLSYGSLVVELWTHTAGGLTQNDFILAAKIDPVQPS